MSLEVAGRERHDRVDGFGDALCLSDSASVVVAFWSVLHGNIAVACCVLCELVDFACERSLMLFYCPDVVAGDLVDAAGPMLLQPQAPFIRVTGCRAQERTTRAIVAVPAHVPALVAAILFVKDFHVTSSG